MNTTLTVAITEDGGRFDLRTNASDRPTDAADQHAGSYLSAGAAVAAAMDELRHRLAPALDFEPTGFTVEDVKLEGFTDGVVSVTVRGYDVAYVEPLDNGSARVAVVAWQLDGDHLTPLPEYFSQVQAIEAKDNPYAGKALRLRLAIGRLVAIRDELEGSQDEADREAWVSLESAFDHIDSAIRTFENPED